MRIINTRPHAITFIYQDGHEETIPPAGIVINAIPEEEVVESRNGIQIVRTAFRPDPQTEKLLEALIQPDALIVGSVIAAQAYPGKILGLVPAPGYERVPPEKRRMNPYKFITFARKPS